MPLRPAPSLHRQANSSHRPTLPAHGRPRLMDEEPGLVREGAVGMYGGAHPTHGEADWVHWRAHLVHGTAPLPHEGLGLMLGKARLAHGPLDFAYERQRLPHECPRLPFGEPRLAHEWPHPAYECACSAHWRVRPAPKRPHSLAKRPSPCSQLASMSQLLALLWLIPATARQISAPRPRCCTALGR